MNVPPTSPGARRPISPGFPSAGGREFRNFYSSHRSINTAESLPASPLMLDYERHTRTSLIKPGTYISFALDAKSLAEGFPVGSNVHQAIGEILPGRYLGLVTSCFTYETEGGQTATEVTVFYVGRTAPSSLPIMSKHHAPIYPTSEISGRSPLRTTVFFPWVDCRQWTTSGVTLAVKHVHGSSLVFTLEDNEFERFEEMAEVDYEHLRSSDMDVNSDCNVQGLSFIGHPLPAEVWLDIREGGEKGEPSKFVNEIFSLES